MIHIVTSENRHLYGSRLLAMGGGFHDEGDDRDIHLLGFNAAMDLEVGLRLRPTDDRCVLADLFPHLIAPAEPSKKGRDIWEVRQGFTAEGARRGARVCEAWAAAIQLGLAHGVTRLIGMIDMRLYPDILDSPIETRLLGLPRPSRFGIIAGSEIALSQGLLDRVLEALRLESPVGYHVDAMDLIAFGDLAAVQRQVERAMTPQFAVGVERDETLAAETLYRLHDRPVRTLRPAARCDARDGRALKT